MDLGLKDKVVVITGGALGIGAAISEACAAEGAIPVMVNRDSEAAQSFAARLRDAGSRCELLTIDLQGPDSCRGAIEETLRRRGRIDALVNNAGTNDKVGLEHGTPQGFMESVHRNLWHYYSMTHYALPSLKAARGSIVNVSSKTAVTGQGGTSGYTASKGAQLALTREWAVELLPYGVRVNAIVPAEVMTPQYGKWIATFPDPEEKLRTITSKIPLGKRMTEAAEIASMTVFLLSDKSGHTTGQHLYVDGGYVHLDRALA
ncbi:MAG TPA: SDR family oxidoreductase [Acidobacteriaceae bacterium]|nr:SDR family oxidoreductase [Acidobacteriaceae bacterium]